MEVCRICCFPLSSGNRSNGCLFNLPAAPAASTHTDDVWPGQSLTCKESNSTSNIRSETRLPCRCFVFKSWALCLQSFSSDHTADPAGLMNKRCSVSWQKWALPCLLMPSSLISRRQILHFVLKTAGSDNNIKYHSSYINDENWE